MTRLKETHPGDIVSIAGVVMDRPGNGQVRILLPGVGDGGTWSLPGTCHVAIVGHVLDAVLEDDE